MGLNVMEKKLGVKSTVCYLTPELIHPCLIKREEKELHLTADARRL